MTKIAGSGSGSISQRHGSADPDPDPPQNVMDPQHCFFHNQSGANELGSSENVNFRQNYTGTVRCELSYVSGTGTVIKKHIIILFPFTDYYTL
jgi:hypothetical protein